MGRHQDKRGFFQRACGRFVLIVSALALLAIAIAVLALGTQASDELDFRVEYTGNSSEARSGPSMAIGSPSCDPPVVINITATEAKWTLAGQYSMAEPKEVALFVGSVLLLSSLMGALGIWKRRDGLIFTYCYLLLLLLAAMLWVAIFCTQAAEKADAFIDTFWKMYAAANPDIQCGDDSYRLPGAGNATHWTTSWIHEGQYFNTAGDVAAAAGASVGFIALSICGTIQALSSVDEAAMKMVRGSSGVLALVGLGLIAAATLAAGRAPGQFAGDWGPQVLGVLGTLLLLAGCCGCCGVRRLSRRCLALNICGLFAFFLTCFVITILTFEMASTGKDQIVGEARAQRLERKVLGQRLYEVALLQHVNTVAISAAVLTIVVFANLCVSVWLFKHVNEVALRRAERLDDDDDWDSSDAARQRSDEDEADGLDERDIELRVARRANDEDYV